MKEFKIIARKVENKGDDFEYLSFLNYAEAFSYCFTKAKELKCDKVELYERTDSSMRNARLCPIAEFYHW